MATARKFTGLIAQSLPAVLSVILLSCRPGGAVSDSVMLTCFREHGDTLSRVVKMAREDYSHAEVISISEGAVMDQRGHYWAVLRTGSNFALSGLHSVAAPPIKESRLTRYLSDMQVCGIQTVRRWGQTPDFELIVEQPSFLNGYLFKSFFSGGLPEVAVLIGQQSNWPNRPYLRARHQSQAFKKLAVNWYLKIEYSDGL